MLLVLSVATGCPAHGWRPIGSALAGGGNHNSWQSTVEDCAAQCDMVSSCGTFKFCSKCRFSTTVRNDDDDDAPNNCVIFSSGVESIAYLPRPQAWESCRRSPERVAAPPASVVNRSFSCDPLHGQCETDARLLRNLAPNLLSQYKTRPEDAARRWATCRPFFYRTPPRTLRSADFKHMPKAGGSAVETFLGIQFQWHAAMRSSKGLVRCACAGSRAGWWWL